jgi:hypothetical protein
MTCGWDILAPVLVASVANAAWGLINYRTTLILEGTRRLLREKSDRQKVAPNQASDH